jgi:hypothetical protein
MYAERTLPILEDVASGVIGASRFVSTDPEVVIDAVKKAGVPRLLIRCRLLSGEVELAPLSAAPSLFPFSGFSL